jgi:nicotinamidase-related amidase
LQLGGRRGTISGLLLIRTPLEFPAMRLPIACLTFILAVSVAFSAGAAEKMLTLHARSQQKSIGKDGKPTFTSADKELRWAPNHTALIICDMWDDHWCKGAAQRVTEMAPAMDKVITAAREQGVLIIHAPSTCVDFYKDTPARQRAQNAKFAKAPIELATSERWGTAWCWPDKDREAALPIDDSDMGCDCKEKCKIVPPWKRQIALLTIDQERDAITDNGQELVNLFAEKKIDHVIIMGVHLNMCVLGRPFAIRQLTKLGKDVVLVRDMTDTMYNSQMRPFVNHFAGTDLVVEHVEKYWCPTITSMDLVGGKPFRFAEDKR